MLLKISFFVIFLSIFYSVASWEFEDAKQEGVYFDTETAGVQKIYADENNDSSLRMKIVKLVGASFDDFTMTTITTNNAIFQPQKIEEGADIYITTYNADYETMGNQKIISIDVTAQGEKKTLVLEIINLIDENPSISSPAECIIPEEQEFTDPSQFESASTCAFTISDADGYLDSIDFSQLVSSDDEKVDELFTFKYKATPGNSTYTSTVYLLLKDGVKLDYEDKALYRFNLEAKDSAGNPSIPTTVPIIVQVDDIPDVAPQWDGNFRSAVSIEEEKETTMTVTAKDGDYKINSPITYDVDDSSGFISIDPNSGVITIKPIDRDVDNNDQITFTVTATETLEPFDSTKGTITLIIQDIDDNIPKITLLNSDDPGLLNIEIEENSNNLDDIDIIANDIDQGENAIYTAELTADNQDFLEAFSIIPGRGYENTSLVLTIRDPTKLDYEKAAWRTIEMKLVTKGTKTETNTDSIPITITLTDLNDESPVFNPAEAVIDVREDVGKDSELNIIVKATDEDAEDIENGLTHELLGTQANNILSIEKLGGKITTKTDNSFDYEKQEEIVVQIRATDANHHSATFQLTINVLDVNDESPKLTVSGAIQVEENQKEGYIFDTTISATDDDTTAKLEFSIDWKQSYATKNSIRLSDENFEKIQCIEVSTEQGEDNKHATAKLTLKETQLDNTPDFETYDTLYIYLIVTDDNTEINKATDSALVVINIKNVNDNPPVFDIDLNNITRRVTENSNDDTYISYVTATDADVGTVLNYSIVSVDDTPDWVKIDASGNLQVSLPSGEVLDCDAGPLYTLIYKVTASDEDFETEYELVIEITDQNDNEPKMENQAATIPEDNELDLDNKTPINTTVLDLKYTDADRDEPYHTVACRFSSTTSTDVTSRFKITDDNKIVVDMADDVILDREKISEFTFQLSCSDDPQRQGSITFTVTPTITITLEDVNDNYPDISNKRITGVNENSKDTISQTLQGEDKDLGNNGLINFVEITKISRFLNEDKTNEQPVDQDLFEVGTNDDNLTGFLKIKPENLKGLYGYLVVTMKLTDLGDPPLSKEVDVTVEVQKYNFEELKFDFPKEGETYYLSKEQKADSTLQMWNSGELSNFKADDQQGNKYTISFSMAEQSEEGLFSISTRGSATQLQLSRSEFTEQKYTITITAKIDGTPVDQTGEAPYEKNCTFYINFFDKDSTDPVFATHEGKVTFKENDESVSYQLEEATYADVGDPEITNGLAIYYLIAKSSDANGNLFIVNKDTGKLTLSRALDYESETIYEVVVQSSNNERLNTDASPETQFKLTINVEDVNDNAPEFNPKDYTFILNIAAGGSLVSKIGTVYADDIDTTSKGKLNFSVDKIKGSAPELEEISQGAFKIDSSSGDITPNFNENKNGLKGYFTLTIKVEDEDGGKNHTDTTDVIVYLVTSENIVQFSFSNDQPDVEGKAEDIRSVLDEIFADQNYISTVDTTKLGSSEDDVNSYTIQNVYFINSKTQEPVASADIYKLVVDANRFKALKNAFQEKGLLLLSFDQDTDSSGNLEDVLKAALIGVSVVLGSLCLILLAAFILKTRALNQRINKLSNTKFGSQESGLNRTGIAAPTTNKHAVEGSNPVYNNDVDTKDIDRRSVTSGDSDLIGVEDDDKFNYSPTSEPNNNNNFRY